MSRVPYQINMYAPILQLFINLNKIFYVFYQNTSFISFAIENYDYIIQNFLFHFLLDPLYEYSQSCMENKNSNKLSPFPRANQKTIYQNQSCPRWHFEKNERVSISRINPTMNLRRLRINFHSLL